MSEFESVDVPGTSLLVKLENSSGSDEVIARFEVEMTVVMLVIVEADVSDVVAIPEAALVVVRVAPLRVAVNEYLLALLADAAGVELLPRAGMPTVVVFEVAKIDVMTEAFVIVVRGRYVCGVG